MIGTAFFEEEGDRQKREAVRRLLEAKFGPLCPAASKELASWRLEKLASLMEAVITASSLRELGLDEAALYRKGES